jgi:hypothetical protein
LTLSRTVWYHTYVLIAWDAAGNTKSVTISYNVFADSVTNINMQKYTVSNLSTTGVTLSRDTDVTAVSSKVSLYADWTSLLDQIATISGTGNTITLNTLTANQIYTVVIKSKVSGQTNYTELSFTITTASAQNGILVSTPRRIYDTDPVAWWGYASGYHFRFDITVNDLTKDTLNFKLADRSNSVTTMATANNTKFAVSAGGVSTPSGTTLTGANIYSSDVTISGIDAKGTVWGRQLILDLFYQIPTWSQGIFSTSYGIQATHTVD